MGGVDLDNMTYYGEMDGFMTNVSLIDYNKEAGMIYGFQAEINHFVDCCLGRCECMSPGEDGVVVMKILNALYESAATGKSVELD